MKKESLKLGLILLSVVIVFAYCGKESPTSPETRGYISISIKEEPIVFTWNSSTGKWETKFTIVLTESGGDRMDVSQISAEAREGDTVRYKFTKQFYGEFNVPANGTGEWVWDYDQFDIPGKDHFDTLRIKVFAVDTSANYQEEEKDFTNLSFEE